MAVATGMAIVNGMTMTIADIIKIEIMTDMIGGMTNTSEIIIKNAINIIKSKLNILKGVIGTNIMDTLDGHVHIAIVQDNMSIFATTVLFMIHIEEDTYTGQATAGSFHAMYQLS